MSCESLTFYKIELWVEVACVRSALIFTISFSFTNVSHACWIPIDRRWYLGYPQMCFLTMTTNVIRSTKEGKKPPKRNWSIAHLLSDNNLSNREVGICWAVEENEPREEEEPSRIDESIHLHAHEQQTMTWGKTCVKRLIWYAQRSFSQFTMHRRAKLHFYHANCSSKSISRSHWLSPKPCGTRRNNEYIRCAAPIIVSPSSNSFNSHAETISLVSLVVAHSSGTSIQFIQSVFSIVLFLNDNCLLLQLFDCYSSTLRLTK